jgi:ABC-2 type transport system permease protein
LPYYITVWAIGPVDHGAVWCGYLGMILMSMSYIGIGLFASSITNNQIVAFLSSLFIGMFFLIIFDVLAGSFTGGISQLFSFLSISTHYESISRGVVDSKDIIYFLSIAFLGLTLAESVLSKRNIVEN